MKPNKSSTAKHKTKWSIKLYRMSWGGTEVVVTKHEPRDPNKKTFTIQLRIR